MQILQLQIPTAGAVLKSLTVKGSGSGDETDEVQLVRIYHDTNNNRMVDTTDELISQGTFQQDNGRLKLVPGTSYQLSGGNQTLLVEYELK